MQSEGIVRLIKFLETIENHSGRHPCGTLIFESCEATLPGGCGDCPFYAASLDPLIDVLKANEDQLKTTELLMGHKP